MDKSALQSIKNNVLASFMVRLGNRRATVSVAAMVLQTEGLIHYSRGHTTITDRAGLEAFSSECYDATRQFK